MEELDNVWIVKDIFESDFGCEERMPGEPLTVCVYLENAAGEIVQTEVAEQWIEMQEIDIGDEWPLDIDDGHESDRAYHQEEMMKNYYEALDELHENDD